MASNRLPFNSLLVPTDFSRASRDAFQWAMSAVDGNESAIIVLHVVDEAVVDLIAAHEFGERDDVALQMRQRAVQRLAEYKAQQRPDIEVDTMVAEGAPFLQIISKADDFAVDAIVMGMIGTRGDLETVLFGSTAEKVLRGTRCPVIVLPARDR